MKSEGDLDFFINKELIKTSKSRSKDSKKELL